VAKLPIVLMLLVLNEVTRGKIPFHPCAYFVFRSTKRYFLNLLLY